MHHCHLIESLLLHVVSKFDVLDDFFYVIVYLLLLLQKDLVIYEMNVRAFTADESSELDPDIRGSYLGVIEKVTGIISTDLCSLRSARFQFL